MDAEIIAVGSELTSGQGLDTNSRWISRRLADLGIAVRAHATIGDDLAANVEAFRLAVERSGLVLVSGGLGPTQDDLTREALAKAAGVGLVEDPGSLAAIAEFFERRNRIMAERNRTQALLPEGAEPLANRVGTAPGIWMRIGNAWLGCLPGVPSEMRVMFDELVVPRLKRLGLADRVIVHRKINLFGKGESEIEAEAFDLTARGRVPEVGITASDATISFRLAASGADEAEAQALLEPTVRTIYDRFGPLVVGEGDEDVAAGLARELARAAATIATAESCTGGMIAERITARPGSSEHFPGGVVSYANGSKVDLLGVPEALLVAHGAVSAEVAEAMAVGVRDRFRAAIGLSVTGIAGPGGGTASKPVGLVYIGLATAGGVLHRRHELGPEQPREIIRSRAAKHALNWARLAARELPDRPTS